jgi:hypothetical protein
MQFENLLDKSDRALLIILVASILWVGYKFLAKLIDDNQRIREDRIKDIKDANEKIIKVIENNTLILIKLQDILEDIDNKITVNKNL